MAPPPPLGNDVPLPSATLSPASEAGGSYATLNLCGASIEISPATSIQSSPSSPSRFLVVGRYATSDVRIDHGSISRRHAALYYLPSEGSEIYLKLSDLGGKQGTRVNGVRMEKGGTVTLRDGDEVVFGRVTGQKFTVMVPETLSTRGRRSGEEGLSKVVDTAAVGGGGGLIALSSEAAVDSESGDVAAKRELGSGLTGRAKREAEIAAMMASLESAPTYTKFRSLDGDGGEVGDGAEDRRREPSRPKRPFPDVGDDGGNDSRGDGGDNPHLLPITRCAPLDSSASSPPDITSSEYRVGGGKVIASLSVDPSGSRLVTGCTDTVLRMYDFAGMDSTRRTFREIEAEEGHPVVAIRYSNTGDRMIVGTTSAQPKVLDRDGREIMQFIKGDPYVTDMSRTVGHTAAVTFVDWHPLERDVVLSSSLDGSARLWNLNGRAQFSKLVCDRVIRAKNAKGQRTGVTCAVFHPGGREIALGTADGSVQVWSCAGSTIRTRPERAVYDVHGPGRPVTSLVYNPDGTRLASRSIDDDVAAVWDARKLGKSSEPIAVCAGLLNLYEASNCAFSPDGTVLAAGTSVEPPKRASGDGVAEGGEQERQRGSSASSCGKLRLYKLPGKYDPPVGAPLIPAAEVDAANPGASTVCVLWHSKLNQIIVGTSDGNARIFYDPGLSSRGALLSASRAMRGGDDLTLLLQSRAPSGSAAVTTEIVTPHALPMFQTEAQRRKAKRGRRQREELKEEEDRAKHRPEAPSTDKARIGGQTSAGANFTQFVVQSMGMTKNKNIAGKDPREDLFQYREGKKSYASGAYEGDVQRVLADKTAEEEEEEMKDGKKDA